MALQQPGGYRRNALEEGEKRQDCACETPTCSPLSNCGVPNTGKDINLLEQVQRKAAKMVREMEYLSCEEKAVRLELFFLEKRRVQGDLVAVFQYL